MFTGHRGISASWSNQLLITAEVSWGIKKPYSTITLLWHSVSCGLLGVCAPRGRIQKQGCTEERSEPVGSSHNKFFIVLFPLAYLWQSHAQRGAVIFSRSGCIYQSSFQNTTDTHPLSQENKIKMKQQQPKNEIISQVLWTMCMGIAQKKKTNKEKAKLSAVATMRYLFSVIKVSLAYLCN